MVSHGGAASGILNFETFPSCYNVYNRIDPAHISIQLDGSFTAVTNLKKAGDHAFVGVGDSITLMGGKIALLPDGQIKDYIPLELYEEPETWAASLSQQWRDVCATLELYGVTPSAGADSEILIAPEEMGRFGSELNRIAFFDHYVLTCGNWIDISAVSQEMFLQYNSESYLASILCSWGGLLTTPQETCSYWLGCLQGGGTNHPLEIALREALEVADAAGKGDEAVQKVTQFLCKEGAVGNEQVFLEGLRDLYDSN